MSEGINGWSGFLFRKLEFAKSNGRMFLKIASSVEHSTVNVQPYDVFSLRALS